jgi:hypothetical protein
MVPSFPGVSLQRSQGARSNRGLAQRPLRASGRRLPSEYSAWRRWAHHHGQQPDAAAPGEPVGEAMKGEPPLLFPKPVEAAQTESVGVFVVGDRPAGSAPINPYAAMPWDTGRGGETRQRNATPEQIPSTSRRG